MNTNDVAYFGLTTNVMDLIPADICSFYQPFEDLAKKKKVNSFFVHFIFSSISDHLITLIKIKSCWASRIL